MKEYTRYEHPTLYYYDLPDGRMKIVGISLDCGYLSDYGGAEPDIESALDILYQNDINISEENIGNGDEDEDFYELIEPLITDGL